MRELKVEMRKCFLRFDFYSAAILFTSVIAFFIYQLCTDGSVVSLQGASEELTFNELMIGILQMAHTIGFVGILLAVLCWRTVGKEFDQQSIVLYILHARSKWNILLAKFITLVVAFASILFVAIFVSYIIYVITAPEHLPFHYTFSAMKDMLRVLFLILLNGSISVLCACIFAMRFGTLGVLGGTIGLTIFSAIFQSNETIKQLLPSQLIYVEHTSFLYSSTVLIAYFLLLILALKVITSRKEFSH